MHPELAPVIGLPPLPHKGREVDSFSPCNPLGENDAVTTTASDKSFDHILGAVIRKARDRQGWTREQLVRLLDSGIGDRTLLSYEHGLRALTVHRLREIASALGKTGAELLGEAEELAADLRGTPIRIQLDQVLKDDRSEFAAVRQWARFRRAETTAGVVVLTPATVGEMAEMMDIPHQTLATYLMEFSRPPD